MYCAFERKNEKSRIEESAVLSILGVCGAKVGFEMLNFRLKWNQMAVSESTTQFVKEQLSEFADVEMKKMFGGVGIFLNGIMFALITAKGQFMMRVGESNIQDFKAKGSQPFNHEKKGRAMPYWEVPVEVAENRDVLKVWAAKAYDVATAAKKKK